MDGNGRGGCCIARYVGPSHDMSKVDRIMLRFRPIAPKPALSSGSGSAESTPEKPEVTGRTGRGKRKCGRETGSKRCNNRRKKSVTNDGVLGSAVLTTTLPLLPGIPGCVKREGRNVPVWLSFEGVREEAGLVVDRTAVAAVSVPQAVRIVASSVTVEHVAEITWGEGEELGCTDEEMRRNLERDTCPGFISDGGGKVTWTNEAYREMVGGTADDVVRVWLEMKETTEEWWPAFTCRVKVQYRSRWGKERSSLTAPCDAWRMDGGGFAWRLDVKAALSLGLCR
ncbi:uncharacterized protein LOC111495145 [Cucurbita maxima]|uniref:Uncharacterized protein LOC111495145 n=1 Tax=Cucurbita maxima TaxID=3661 RepID=A0A6J1KEN9_CUCMA|nr:uncharacterized protein LOC111495145 [Cucurbita maxima]